MKTKKVIVWSMLVVTAILFAVAVLSLHLRPSRGTDDAAPAPALPSTGRYLQALTVGASSCALTTPALAAGIWHNWLIGTPNKRSLIADDH